MYVIRPTENTLYNYLWQYSKEKFKYWENVSIYKSRQFYISTYMYTGSFLNFEFRCHRRTWVSMTPDLVVSPGVISQDCPFLCPASGGTGDRGIAESRTHFLEFKNELTSNFLDLPLYRLLGSLRFDLHQLTLFQRPSMQRTQSYAALIYFDIAWIIGYYINRAVKFGGLTTYRRTLPRV